MHYLLRGTVIKGEQMGRKIKYPTANIDRRYFRTHPVPDGVWACRVRVTKAGRQGGREAGGWLKGVAVIGMEDAIRGGKKIEIHILDFKKNIYGRYAEAIMLQRLRKLRKFTSQKLLIRQIKKDIAITRRIVLE